MNRFLREYVEMGLSEIVVLEESFTESEAGYGSHRATETVAARKGDQFVKLSVSEHAWFGFKGGRSFAVTSEQAITEDQYRQSTTGKAVVDTPEDVQQARAEQAGLRRRYELEHKLDEISPKCPKCGATMMYKSGRYGPFWGCPKYPNCDGTVNMSPEARSLYKE